MELNQDSIKIIILIITIIFIGYCIFLLYQDLMYVRSEIKSLRNEYVSLYEKINSFDNKTKPIGIDNDIINDDDEDDETEDIGDNLDENDTNNSDIYYNWNDDSGILNHIHLNSKELKNLHQVQSEIEGTYKLSTITELDEENKSVIIDEKENEDQNNEDTNNDLQFISNSSKCPIILKSGKKKGVQCNKDLYKNFTTCKLHSKNAVEIFYS